MELRPTGPKRLRTTQPVSSDTDYGSDIEEVKANSGVSPLKRKQPESYSQRNAEKARKSRDHNRARLQEVNSCLLSSLQSIQGSKQRLQPLVREKFRNKYMHSEAIIEGLELSSDLNETNAVRIPGKSFASEILHTAKILKVVIERYVAFTDQLLEADESQKNVDEGVHSLSRSGKFYSNLPGPVMVPMESYVAWQYPKDFQERENCLSESCQTAPNVTFLDTSSSRIQNSIGSIAKHEESCCAIKLEKSFEMQMKQLDALFERQQQTLETLLKLAHPVSTSTNVVQFETERAKWDDDEEEDSPTAQCSSSGRRTKAKAKRAPRQGILMNRGLWALGETNSLSGYLNQVNNDLPMDLSCTLSSHQRSICKV